MKRYYLALIYLPLIAGLLAPSGCVKSGKHHFQGGRGGTSIIDHSLDIEYADVNSPTNELNAQTGPPITIHDNGPKEYWNLTLEQAVRTTLENSTVLRDLGGTVLQAPDTVESVYTPSLTETDAQFGVGAALSAFDASFSSNAFYEKNDRQLNNQFFGGGIRTLKQHLFTSEQALTKTTAYGTQFTARHNMEYDNNNAPGNQFKGAWTVFLEGEFRHPLMRGNGVEYNRIVGPNGTPGVYNGVLIARINTDISTADFEMGVRDLISDVENAYWELHYSYRDLDGKVAARDRALALWRAVHARSVVGGDGGEAKNEALAREQYYRLNEDVQNALVGRVIEKTRTSTFRAYGGVHVNERRLRLAMGVPINDTRLIRPADEPMTAKVMFDWDEAMIEALTRRAELRRQQWQVKRAELEMTASRNFLLPQVDVIGRNRWRGFGEKLINPTGNSSQQFEYAWENLLDGDFQEFQVGVEMNYNLGFRQAHAAVRNAQLNWARQKAVLEEQEREITHDLSVWIAEVERAYVIAQNSYNRRLAAKEQLEALEAEYSVERDTDTLNLVLQSQRRMVDAETSFYRALAEYNLAIKQVHLQKGSLLEYNGIALSESAWASRAYLDAAKLARRRVQRHRMENYVMSHSSPVSKGAVPQHLSEIEVSNVEETLPGVPVEETFQYDGESIQGAPLQGDTVEPELLPELHETDAAQSNPANETDGVAGSEAASDLPPVISGKQYRENLRRQQAQIRDSANRLNAEQRTQATRQAEQQRQALLSHGMQQYQRAKANAVKRSGDKNLSYSEPGKEIGSKPSEAKTTVEIPQVPKTPTPVATTKTAVPSSAPGQSTTGQSANLAPVVRKNRAAAALPTGGFDHQPTAKPRNAIAQPTQKPNTNPGTRPVFNAAPKAVPATIATVQPMQPRSNQSDPTGQFVTPKPAGAEPSRTARVVPTTQRSKAPTRLPAPARVETPITPTVRPVSSQTHPVQTQATTPKQKVTRLPSSPTTRTVSAQRVIATPTPQSIAPQDTAKAAPAPANTLPFTPPPTRESRKPYRSSPTPDQPVSRAAAALPRGGFDN